MPPLQTYTVKEVFKKPLKKFYKMKRNVIYTTALPSFLSSAPL